MVRLNGGLASALCASLFILPVLPAGPVGAQIRELDVSPSAHRAISADAFPARPRLDRVGGESSRVRLASSATSHPLDPGWSSEFGLPGFDSTPLCVVADGAQILFGGAFTQIGDVSASGVAAWDGTSVSPLGAGVSFPIRALRRLGGALVAAGGEGDIYFGGPSVATWDGSHWTTIGYSDGAVAALAVHQGTLVAGGYFIDVLRAPGQDLEPHGDLCGWNGTNWVSLGPASDVRTGITTLVSLRESLYVGTDYEPSSSVGSCVRVWNGSTFDAAGAGLQRAAGGFGRVYSLVTDGVHVFAAGTFDRSGPTPLGSTIARFDGAQWTGVGHAMYESRGLAFWKGRLVASIADAAGWHRTHVLEAGEWVVVDTSSLASGRIEHAALDTTLVRNTASYLGAAVAFGPVAHDGTAWRPIQQPWAPGMQGITRGAVLHDHAGEWLAGGFSRYGLGNRFERVFGLLRWTGSTWTSAADPGLVVSAMADDSTGALHVAGRDSQARVKRLDGGVWSTLGQGFNGTPVGIAFYQGAPFVAGDLWATSTVGYFEGVARYNGSSWEPPAGWRARTPYSYRLAAAGIGVWGTRLAVHGGLFVLEHELPPDGHETHGLAFFDGTDFEVPGSLYDPEGPYYRWPNAAVEYEGRLVLGCEYPGKGAISWDGAAWHSLEAGAERVLALCVADGRLFGGGMFERADQTLTWGVAEWNGASWQLLGSGMNGPVRGLVEFGGDLYATGDFGWANGKPSFGIARWRGLHGAGSPPASARGLRLSAPRPNPAAGAQRFELALPSAGAARLAIVDLAGRHVVTLCDGLRTAGSHAVSWDGRDGGGHAVAPGLYFARLTTAAGSAQARVLRVR